MRLPFSSEHFVRADHARIWALAGPMILASLSTPLLGIVDTAILGHLPDPRYLGAVAVGSTLIHFLFWVFGFLRMGTTGFAAHACGADDGDELRLILARALLLAATLGATLLLAQWPLRTLGFWLIEPGAGVMADAVIYFDIRIWAAPATLANYVFIGWFLGLQRARYALWLTLCINLLNILFNLLFVLGLGMKADGVALGSLLAECGGLLLALLLARSMLRRQRGRLQWQRLLNAAQLKRFLLVKQHLFLRTAGLLFAFAFFTAQGARAGELVLAANAVLLNFLSFMAFGLDGFAHAAEALVGKSLGGGRLAALRRDVLLTGFWSLVTALLFVALYAVSGPAIVHLLTDLPEVRAAALAYLPWLVAAPLLGVWAYWLDGIFIGASRARELSIAMLACVLLIYLPAWYLLQDFGNHGLWAAMLLFLAARGVSLGWIYVNSDGAVGMLRRQ